SQRASRRALLAADASKSRAIAGCKEMAVSSWPIWIIARQPLQVHPTVDGEDVSGRKWERAIQQREHRLPHVLPASPALSLHRALGDELVVFFFGPGGHVRGHDAGANFEGLNVVGRQARCP